MMGPVQKRRDAMMAEIAKIIDNYSDVASASGLIARDDELAGGHDDDYDLEYRELMDSPHYLASFVLVTEFAPMDSSMNRGSVCLPFTPPGQATLHTRGLVRHVADMWGLT